MATTYINVQGDEPIFNPDDLKQLIDEALRKPDEILCGYTAIKNESEFFSSSVPKLVFSTNQKLIYISRAAIPGNKDGDFEWGYRQVCAYAFPREALLAFAEAEKKTRLEEVEDIEILRFLEMGYSVHMVPMSDQSIPVDHPEDIFKVERFLKKN